MEPTSETGGPSAPASPGAEVGSARIPIALIRPNPDQPRREINEASAEFVDLRGSIWAHGLIQPVVVWRPPGEDGYMLLAGERRWRAFRSLAAHDPARFGSIPAVEWTDVRRGAAATAITVGLLENVVREDLRPGDRAAAVARLRQLTGWDFAQISQQMGMSLSRVHELATMGVSEAVTAALNDGRLTRETGLPIARVAKGDDQLALELVGAVTGLEPRLVADVVDEVRATPVDMPPIERVRHAIAAVEATEGARVQLRATPIRAVKPRMTSMPRADYIAMLRRALREVKSS